MQLLRIHVESEKDLATAISLEDARREGRHLPPRTRRLQLLQYTENLRYVEQLRRYEERFSREQMLILIYDDFQRDNEGTVRSVLRFLEVDDAVPIESVQRNRAAGMRSRRLDKLVHSVSMGRGPASGAAKATLKALTPRQLRRGALRVTQRRIVHGAAPEPDERFMLELRRRFKGEVVALSEYVDRDLVKLWGYDEDA